MRAVFIVNGPPIGKQRPRVTKHGTYTPAETAKFERRVGLGAMAARGIQRWPLDARYRVTIWAHFPDARRRDIDNIAKSCLDGMIGVLFGDDSQVDSLRVERSIDREQPRTEVTVEVIA